MSPASTRTSTPVGSRSRMSSEPPSAHISKWRSDMIWNFMIRRLFRTSKLIEHDVIDRARSARAEFADFQERSHERQPRWARTRGSVLMPPNRRASHYLSYDALKQAIPYASPNHRDRRPRRWLCLHRARTDQAGGLPANLGARRPRGACCHHPREARDARHRYRRAGHLWSGTLGEARSVTCIGQNSARGALGGPRCWLQLSTPR